MGGPPFQMLRQERVVVVVVVVVVLLQEARWTSGRMVRHARKINAG